MTELARGTVSDERGTARFVVQVTIPDDVWYPQESGLPGFVLWAVYEVEAAWETIWSAPGVDAPQSRLGPLYARAGARSNLTLTVDLAEAEQAASGSVKWDGCVDWQAGTEGVLAHACDADGLRLFLDAVALGYRLAYEQVSGEVPAG